MRIISDRWITLNQAAENAMEKYLVRGAAAALIHNGSVSHAACYGMADPDEKRPVDGQTHFEIASLTKTVFAYYVLNLEEQGKIDLDRPLVTYADQTILLPSDDPAFQKVTARHVLMHASGLPNWGDAPLALRCTPGTSFSYSGKAYTFLQEIVEHIMGARIDVLLQEDLFNPLGMSDAAMIWTGPLNRTLSRSFDGNGAVEPPRHTCRRSVAIEPNVAFTLYSTIHDYTAFVRHLMAEPEKIRKIRSSRNPVSRGVSWGLGWGMYREVLWHWGDNGGFKSFVIFDPETGDGMVIHTNSYHGLNLCYDLVAHMTDFDLDDIRYVVAHAE